MRLCHLAHLLVSQRLPQRSHLIIFGLLRPFLPADLTKAFSSMDAAERRAELTYKTVLGEPLLVHAWPLPPGLGARLAATSRAWSPESSPCLGPIGRTKQGM